MRWASLNELLDTVQKIWAPLRKLFAPPPGPKAGYGPGGENE